MTESKAMFEIKIGIDEEFSKCKSIDDVFVACNRVLCLLEDGPYIPATKYLFYILSSYAANSAAKKHNEILERLVDRSVISSCAVEGIDVGCLCDKGLVKPLYGRDTKCARCGRKTYLGEAVKDEHTKG